MLCNCVVWDDDERKGESETRCRLIACSSRKAPRGPPMRRTNRYQQYYSICLLNIHTAEGFGIKSRPMLHNLAIRKCTSPPLLAPRLKIFKLKFTTPPGIEPRTCWTRGRHGTIWTNAASMNQLLIAQEKKNEFQKFVFSYLFYDLFSFHFLTKSQNAAATDSVSKLKLAYCVQIQLAACVERMVYTRSDNLKRDWGKNLVNSQNFTI